MPLFHDKANEAKKQYISWVVKEGKLYAHKALKRALRGKLRLFREYCAKWNEQIRVILNQFFDYLRAVKTLFDS